MPRSRWINRMPDIITNGPIEDLPRNISPASIVGLPEYKIQNVTLQNIEIVSPGGGNPYYAYRGLTPAELDSIPEMATSYPEFRSLRNCRPGVFTFAMLRESFLIM